MKRTIALMLAVILGIGLAACGSNSNSESSVSPSEKDVQGESTVAESPSPSSLESETPTEQEANSTTGEEVTELADSGDIGDYHISILDYTLTEDYQGNSAIVVNFEFTNNSSENAAFLYSVNAKAFQDGVELSSAVIADVNVYDAEAYIKEVQSGASITCQRAYVLTSENPVQVDVSELLSLSSTSQLTKTFELSE